jgi:hypothetical protein
MKFLIFSLPSLLVSSMGFAANPNIVCMGWEGSGPILTLATEPRGVIGKPGDANYQEYLEADTANYKLEVILDNNGFYPVITAKAAGGVHIEGTETALRPLVNLTTTPNDPSLDRPDVNSKLMLNPYSESIVVVGCGLKIQR